MVGESKVGKTGTGAFPFAPHKRGGNGGMMRKLRHTVRLGSGIVLFRWNKELQPSKYGPFEGRKEQ
jgi:hypothetical protein